MQKVGVMAVVESLSSFKSGMGQIDSLIKGLVPGSDLLSGAFETLGNIASGVTDFALNVLAHTIGELLADAVQWAVGQFKELIQSSLDAADTFQRLQVRLDRLNFNELKYSGEDMTNALERSTEMTKEQLDWLNKLAAQTPYDPTEIANVYTLARGYGFASDEADDLTQAVVNFAAGMGLSEVHINRIITNFGQMAASGKVAGTELKDLARGAFVPVNRLLQIMATSLNVNATEMTDATDRAKVMEEFYKKLAESIGVSSEQMIEMANTNSLTKDQFEQMGKAVGLSATEVAKFFEQGGTAASMFFEAFKTMVNDDFAGAAESMNSVLYEAIENLKEMFNTFVGYNIIIPIFEKLSSHFVDLQQAIFARWDDINEVTRGIGKNIAEILGEILGLAPSATSMADGLVSGFQAIADWLETNKGGIVDFFKGAVTYIQDTVIPTVQRFWDFLFGSDQQRVNIGSPFEGLFAMLDFDDNPLTGFFEDISSLLSELAPLAAPVMELFDALIEVGAEIVGVSFGSLEDKSLADNVKAIAEGISEFAQALKDNKEWIARVVVTIGIMVGIMAAGAAVISLLVNIFGFLISLAIVPFFLSIVAVVYQVISIINGMRLSIIGMMNIFLIAKNYITTVWNETWAIVRETLAQAIQNIKDGKWKEAGQDIINGIRDGIKNANERFKEFIAEVAEEWISKFKEIFGIASPSTVMFDMGLNIIQGLINGMNSVVGRIAETFENAKRIVIDKLNAMKNSAQAKVIEIVNSVRSEFEKIKDRLANIDLRQTGVNIMTKFKDGIEQVKTTILNKFGTFNQEVLDVLGSRLGDFFQIGYDWVMAIVNGQGAAKTWLIDMATKVIQEAYDAMVDFIKKQLGIGGSESTFSVRNVTELMPSASQSNMQTSAPAQNITNRTQNYTLVINTSAPVENIMQDFSMMESLSSGD